MKKRIIAFVLACVMVLGSAALAAGAGKTISVTHMTMTVNGTLVTPTKSDGTAAEVFAYNGATYVPLRYLSELLGIEVNWDKENAGTAALVSDKISASSAGQTYTASVNGFGGLLQVKVTVSGDKITDVEITENHETPGIGTNAVDLLPDMIVEHQSVALDAVSGCTVSSNAIFLAVSNALADSGLDLDKLNTAPAKDTATGKDITLNTDIVVVGGGLAGLAAASKARELGANVILLEKLSFTGGNSALSTGIFHFGHTDIQAKAGIEDTVEDFKSFATEKGEGHRDPVLVDLIGKNGNDAVNWLISAGVAMSDKVSLITGGDSTPRGHQALPSAAAMTQNLTDHAVNSGVDLYLNTAATELITDGSGAVTGVNAKDTSGNMYTIHAKNTILAAGGFAADPDKLKTYWGMDNVGYAGSPGSTGEMIEACLSLGADTLDMEVPWLTPTVEKDTNTLITAMILASGAILVDSHGERFCDEEASYAETSASVHATGESYVNEIFDSQAAEAVNYKFPSYQDMGVVVEANTLEELAEKLEVPADALISTVDAYNAGVRGDAKDPYGRTIILKECNKAPYYAIRVRPGTVMSAGGLKVNQNSQVVKPDGSVIPGVYATGEMVGGYRAYGYIGGDALALALTTGLAAAQHAAG